MSKASVIYNSSAGGLADITESIAQLAARYDCDLRLLAEASELATAIHEAAANQASRIIVAGGDGTIGQSINSLLPIFGEVEFGILPLGTANDLSRSLDIPAADLERAFEIAVTRPVIPIDVVHVHNGISTHFVNAATGGFGGEVTASLTDSNKQLWGPFSYWMSAMGKLVDLHAFDVQLELDGEPSQLRIFGMGIANGRYVGGGFPIAAGALLDDGLMDLTIIPELPTLELLGAGINFMLGRQTDGAGVLTKRARRVTMRTQPSMHFSLDGEPTKTVDAVFEVLPGALHIAAGDKPAIKANQN
jgi:diacylglycerol kinase (ATP)